MVIQVETNPVNRGLKWGLKSLLRRMWKNRWTYFFLLPGLVFLVIFAYWPMYGITLSFKDFQMRQGILNSPWSVPLYRHFLAVMDDPGFWHAFANTFRMGFFYILTGFPAPIILALLLNEMKLQRLKKTFQVIYTFPNFLSWVMVGGIMVSFFASDGFVNIILSSLGADKVEFLTSTALTRPMLYASAVWKSVGWSSIIYLASISQINPELYEAAEIDGANRFHKMLHITWPGIKPTAVILLVLSFGGIMNSGFDQILNMVNPVVKEAAEVLDTYIYRKTFQGVPNYSVSTAMGLFKSVINFVFLLSANKIAKALGGGGIL